VSIRRRGRSAGWGTRLPSRDSAPPVVTGTALYLLDSTRAYSFMVRRPQATAAYSRGRKWAGNFRARAEHRGPVLRS
jgi:hypothetical protein